MKIFKRILIAGWAIYLLTVALLFAFPKRVGPIFHPYIFGALYFGLGMALLLLGTLVYRVLRAYRKGMSRARGPKGAASQDRS